MRSIASTSSSERAALSRPIARASVALFLLAALASATHLFDPVQLLRALPELCLVHRLLGIDCPGCGMGRALAHLAKGELGTAVRLHPFAPVLLMLTLGYAVAPRASVAALERDRVLGAALPALFIAAIVIWWFCTKII